MSTLPERPPLKILLADDGSEHARAAVTLLGDLALPSTSSVVAMRVFSSLQISEQEDMQKALDQTQAKLLSKGIQAKTELLVGHPAEKLIEYADQYHPDLIVMGAKGLRATLGILLGGIAQQVVEYAQWPVLVVRAPYQGLRQVLLVTDGSIYSQRAAYSLRQFPLPAGVQIHIMHVLSPLPRAAYMIDAARVGTMMPSALAESDIMAAYDLDEEQGQKILSETEQILRAYGLQATSVLMRGDAATEIMQYLQQQEIDLVVAGSRGLSRVRGWLMGSVSRKLVHYAGCSVMIVKGED